MTCCLYTIVVCAVGVLLDCFFVDRDDSLNCCHTCFRSRRRTSMGTQVDEIDLPFGVATTETLLPRLETAEYDLEDGVEQYDIAEILGGSVRRTYTGSPI